MTAQERMLALTGLTGAHSAEDHFMSITTGSGALSGSIRLDSNATMDIAIPVKGWKVKEYLLDWIANETGRAAEDSVRYCTARVANDASIGVTLAFVPGVTNPANDGNFLLVTADEGSEEITGFRIKMKDYSGFHADTLVFNWTTGDNK